VLLKSDFFPLADASVCNGDMKRGKRSSKDFGQHDGKEGKGGGGRGKI